MEVTLSGAMLTFMVRFGGSVGDATLQVVRRSFEMGWMVRTVRS
jgi:hypothetical protein